jgi:hypothetical protein
VSRWLLVLWVALLDADRINLLGDLTSFVTTPFLVLTPLVVAVEIVRHTRAGLPSVMPRATIGYAALCAALVGLTTASVIASTETGTSAARVALLVAQITGTLAVAVLIIERPDMRVILARGAALGLALFVLFDVLDAASLLGSFPDTANVGPIAISFKTYTYTGFIPRLAGPVTEPNRAGLVLVTFAFFILRGEPRRTWRRLLIATAVPLLLITLSRSAILAALITTALTVLAPGRRRIPPSVLATGAATLALVAIFFAFSPGPMERAVERIAPLTRRLSLAEGSSRDHLSLLTRGFAEGTASAPRLAVGMGYGNAYTVLQDFFPGNRYGSFHSLYVSMFAESGLIAFLVTCVLLLVPSIIPNPYRALIAGAAAYNVFQNAGTDPPFWLALALAWLTGAWGVRHVAWSARPRQAGGDRRVEHLPAEA